MKDDTVGLRDDQIFKTAGREDFNWISNENEWISNGDVMFEMLRGYFHLQSG